MEQSKFTAASFFTGIGGLDLAAMHAGFEVTHMSEIDPYARKILKKRFPQAILLGDIHDIKGTQLNKPDLIFGGFPCQDISAAGYRAGINGERSGLFFELARIIGEARPSVIVLENVSAILHRGLGTVIGKLSHLGYDGVWGVVRASSVGSPQHRKRWFYVGYTDSVGRQSAKGRGLHTSNVWADSTEQQIQKRDASQSARKSRRNRRGGVL